MTIVNDGRPCALTMYGVPTQRRNPATDGVVRQEPRNGTVQIVGHRIEYTPEGGYVGADEFTYEGRAAGESGQAVALKVGVKVTVRAGR